MPLTLELKGIGHAPPAQSMVSRTIDVRRAASVSATTPFIVETA
jgi:hypothetical protein